MTRIKHIDGSWTFDYAVFDRYVEFMMNDVGINRLIASKTKPGSFFMSDGMHFDRAKDGAHPTRRSAELWMDSVARWITLHSAHPIKLDKPAPGTARATSVTVLQPKK